MEHPLFPYLEWELLREPITISTVEDSAELPEGPKNIVISRDEDYNLRATLFSKNSGVGGVLHRSPAVAGSFPETFNIEGSKPDRVHYTLESCLIGGGVHTIREDEEVSTISLEFNGLRMRYKNENEWSRLTEWYLNGPKDRVFHRVTDRKLSRNFSRTRLASIGNKIDSVEVSGEDLSVGVDFLRIQVSDFQFLVAKVPKGIGPDWSSNIGIEYQKAWGRIPDVHEREKIEELCSFVFGRQLLSVGYTFYDGNKNIKEGYVHNPWGNEAKYYCSEHDDSPIRISNSASGKAEDVIGHLLPTYYELREPLRLKEALWLYWISRRMPIGTNLPILAAALESVINGWFKYAKSKNQGVYMKKEEFEGLLNTEIGVLKRKLENIPDGDKIFAKILQAHSFGIAERYRFFFQEIGLSVDSGEWEAIGARHKLVHGHMIFDETDWKRVIQRVNTFETLLNKVLLKLLGYSGTFIDRSVVGWNDKQLG